MFNASLAKNISADDTASWNNKFGFKSQDLTGVLGMNNDGRGMQLKNAEIPVHPQDMATKVYVDALETKLDEMENLLVNAGLYDIKDVEGNLYHAVKIGNQIWMEENLRTTKYNDGHEIPYAVIVGLRYSDTATYCWLGNNQAAYGGTYGPLYNYYTVETGAMPG